VIQYVVWLGLARTIYIRRIRPYIWWNFCQKYCIHTVYIWFGPTLRMTHPCVKETCASRWTRYCQPDEVGAHLSWHHPSPARSLHFFHLGFRVRLFTNPEPSGHYSPICTEFPSATLICKITGLLFCTGASTPLNWVGTGLSHIQAPQYPSLCGHCAIFTYRLYGVLHLYDHWASKRAGFSAPLTWVIRRLSLTWVIRRLWLRGCDKKA